MHNKHARISLKLKKGDKVSVKKGEKISQGDVILTEKNVKLSEFNLSKLLNVKPDQVAALLFVVENQPIKVGDLIAKKSGLFDKKFIKSPVSGKFIWVDKDTGTVGIKEETPGEVVKAYFDGMVEEVTPTEVLFTVSGTIIAAKAGKGKPVTGTLLVLPAEITALTLPTEIANMVLLLKEATSDVMAKADTLGAVGILAENVDPPSFSLPYLTFPSVTEFGRHHGATVILYGDKKELLILEEKGKTE